MHSNESVYIVSGGNGIVVEWVVDPFGDGNGNGNGKFTWECIMIVLC